MPSDGVGCAAGCTPAGALGERGSCEYSQPQHIQEVPTGFETRTPVRRYARAFYTGCGTSRFGFFSRVWHLAVRVRERDLDSGLGPFVPSRRGTRYPPRPMGVFFFPSKEIDIWAVETPPKFRAEKKKRLGRAGRRGAAQGAVPRRGERGPPAWRATGGGLRVGVAERDHSQPPPWPSPPAAAHGPLMAMDCAAAAPAAAGDSRRLLVAS